VTPTDTQTATVEMLSAKTALVRRRGRLPRHEADSLDPAAGGTVWLPPRPILGAAWRE
jgi:hypothetical protein